jgi:hypothetical protein
MGAEESRIRSFRGRNRAVSTPRVQRMMFLNPRPVSSRSREGVLTIMARAA